MATIRERGAALKLADKLRVPRPDAGAAPLPVPVPVPVPVVSGDECVGCWSGVLCHLRASVTLKRRRVLLRSHAPCFVGSDAVDAVSQHMQSSHTHCQQGVSGSREKAVCVCQALLERGVFEAVGGSSSKDRKKLLFQDTKSSLYRFADVAAPPLPLDEAEGGALPSGLKSPGTPSHTWRLGQELGGVVGRTPSPKRGAEPEGASRERTHTPLPQSLVEEVWQEQTLLRLLSLVELPLLEGVLHCCQDAAAAAAADCGGDPAHGGEQLDRQILKAFRDLQEDEWLRAALDCVDFLPQRVAVRLSRELPFTFPQDGGGGGVAPPVDGLSECKLLLFSTLVQHYSGWERPPLLPQPMANIYTAIAELLVKAQFGRALEALQLCLKLLPPRGREELRRLLTFMAQAADGQQIRLDKEVENRLAVRRSFSRAILHTKSLAKDKEELLLLFMLSNIKDLFKLPGALHKGVSERLASALRGTQPPHPSGSDVSGKSPSDSTKSTTDQELLLLLSNIHQDTKLSSKERKRLLGQFYRAHPQIFNKYFGESALSVL